MIRHTYNNLTESEHNLVDDLLDITEQLCYLIAAFDEFEYEWRVSKEHNSYFITLDFKPKNKHCCFDTLFRVVNEDLKTAIEIWNKNIILMDMKEHFALRLTRNKVQRLVITKL